MTFFENIKKIHFIGIGGVSMNALALCLLNMGFSVTGSDVKSSDITNNLIASGIPVFIGHSKDNIKSPDLVVYTAAIAKDNVELLEVNKRDIKSIERAVLLGELMKLYDTPIGIAGTHGKTTVTSMISMISLEANADPTIMVGGVLPEIEGNLRLGKGKPFIFESCEYSNSFLNFSPKISVILNIDEDHLDFFKDINDIINSFAKYTKNTLAGGTIIANAEDANVTTALKDYKGNITTFGIDKGDYTASDVDISPNSTSFVVNHNKQPITQLNLKIFGIHNIKNALAAFATGCTMGVEHTIIKKALERFTGTARRFELKKEINKIRIYDDYAHHPTEVLATITSAKKMSNGKVIVAFQPHTYTRVKTLSKGFADALTLADMVILAPIYAAREKNIYNVSSQDIKNLVPNSKYIEEFSKIAQEIERIARPGDIVITMGAGDITNLSEMIFN